ncbi:MAG TPA: hypothetical protein VF163_07935, partial [Micromonosporaceae bacterium]
RAFVSRHLVPRADYVTHTATRSQVRMLPEPTRQRFLDRLTEALDETVPLAVQAVLYLAQRTATAG